MQYKIPVQIENEDPIIFWLSLRQLIILMIWCAIAYGTFNWLTSSVWAEVAAIPWIFIALVTFLVAVFKHSEMTFVPFILNLLRYQVNGKERVWEKGIDSFQPIDIGFVTAENETKENTIDFQDKIDKIKELDDKLNKI